jgi:hypothetical protein
MVVALALTIVVVLFATTVTRSRIRRENTMAAGGDGGVMPWMDGSGGSDCAPGGDAGCGDGGGGD